MNSARAGEPGGVGDTGYGDTETHGPGTALPARHGVRASDLFVSAALHDAVAARAFPQSGWAGHHRAHGLGGEATAPRVTGLQGTGHLDARSRVALAIRVAARDEARHSPRGARWRCRARAGAFRRQRAR